jgi:molecular chaperone HscB
MTSPVATPIPDHFSLFGLEPRFSIDQDQLTRAYRTVQSHVHPDRFAAAGAAEQRAALQWATLANEAYQVLHSPVRRAAYLCERNGAPVSANSGQGVGTDFLDLQLEWRQALEQVRRNRDPQRLDRLRSEALALSRHELDELQVRLDGRKDYTGAADGVRRLMFIEKFLLELAQADEAGQADPAPAV